MKKRELLLAFSSIIYSITLLFVLINNFASRTEEHWRFFYAFTQQSNILVLLFLIAFIFTVFRKNCKLNFVRKKTVITAVTVYISITYLIVALVLDPVYKGAFEPVKSASELWTHHLTPIYMWFMFFLIKGEGEVNVKKSVLTLIYPLVYLIANIIIGYNVNYLNGEMAFAYGFINPTNYSNVFIFILVILGLLLVFSLFTIGLSKFKIFIDNNYHTKENAE